MYSAGVSPGTPDGSRVSPTDHERIRNIADQCIGLPEQQIDSLIPLVKMRLRTRFERERAVEQQLAGRIRAQQIRGLLEERDAAKRSGRIDRLAAIDQQLRLLGILRGRRVTRMQTKGRS